MKLPFTLLSLGLIASLAFVFCSCETESTGGGGALTVSPASATVPVGGSVTLKARGGDVYTWDIVNSTSNSIGMLSANSGPSVVYTALSGPGEEVTVRVSTTVGTSASVGTNSTSSATSRDVKIKHDGVKSSSSSTSFKPSSSGGTAAPPSPGSARILWTRRDNGKEMA